MLILDEPRSQLLRERWERAVRLGARADGEAYPQGASGADLAVRRDVARSTVYRALRG